MNKMSTIYYSQRSFSCTRDRLLRLEVSELFVVVVAVGVSKCIDKTIARSALREAVSCF